MKLTARLLALGLSALISTAPAMAQDWAPKGPLTINIGFGGGVAMFTGISQRPADGRNVGMGVSIPVLVQLVQRGGQLPGGRQPSCPAPSGKLAAAASRREGVARPKAGGGGAALFTGDCGGCWPLRAGRVEVSATKRRSDLAGQTRHRPAIGSLHDRPTSIQPAYRRRPRRVQRAHGPPPRGGSPPSFATPVRLRTYCARSARGGLGTGTAADPRTRSGRPSGDAPTPSTDDRSGCLPR